MVKESSIVMSANNFKNRKEKEKIEKATGHYFSDLTGKCVKCGFDIKNEPMKWKCGGDNGRSTG